MLLPSCLNEICDAYVHTILDCQDVQFLDKIVPA